MKVMGFLFALVFVQTTLAGLLDVDLKMDGRFNKEVPVRATLGMKECLQLKGRYLGKKSCIINHREVGVNIEKSLDQDTYKVSIVNVNSSGHVCSFEGEAVAINQVQMKAQNDSCEVTIGFTDKNTLATWTNGQCSMDCGLNTGLDHSNIKRSVK